MQALALCCFSLYTLLALLFGNAGCLCLSRGFCCGCLLCGLLGGLLCCLLWPPPVNLLLNVVQRGLLDNTIKPVKPWIR
ncbi:hypothetical protein ACWXV6_22200 [Pantoea ananatis]